MTNKDTNTTMTDWTVEGLAVVRYKVEFEVRASTKEEAREIANKRLDQMSLDEFDTHNGDARVEAIWPSFGVEGIFDETKEI